MLRPLREARSRFAPSIALAAIAGVVLAAAMWFGLIPTVLRLHAQHSRLVTNGDPRLLDLRMLALNIALLVCLFGVYAVLRRRGRRSEPSE